MGKLDGDGVNSEAAPSVRKATLDFRFGREDFYPCF